MSRTMNIKRRPIVCGTDFAIHAMEAANVLGTHQRHRLNRFWLGPVRQKVMKQSSRPLRVVCLPKR